jgi:hypothetical protein
MIDVGIALNFMLIEDGPHPAVDGDLVRKAIDRDLDRRLVIFDIGSLIHTKNMNL